MLLRFVCFWILCVRVLAIVDETTTEDGTDDDYDRTDLQQTLPGLLLNSDKIIPPHIIKTLAQSHQTGAEQDSWTKDDISNGSIFQNNTILDISKESGWDAINHALGYISLFQMGLVCLLHFLANFELICDFFSGKLNCLDPDLENETESISTEELARIGTSFVSPSQRPPSSGELPVNRPVAAANRLTLPQSPRHFARYLLPACTWTETKFDAQKSTLSSASFSSAPDSSNQYQRRTNPYTTNVKSRNNMAQVTREITVLGTPTSGITVVQAKSNDSFETRILREPTAAATVSSRKLN